MVRVGSTHSPTRLIINADDFGISRGVNIGIIEAAVAEVVTSASMIVNQAFVEAFLPGKNAIGEVFDTIGDDPNPVHDLGDQVDHDRREGCSRKGAQPDARVLL